MASWAQQCYEYMVFPGESAINYCKSAFLGGWDFSQGTDVPAGTVPWGCACQAADGDTGIDTDAAWKACFLADQEQLIMQDDGSEKNEMIIEFATIVKACKHDLVASGPFPGGIWIGGVKHSMTAKTMEPVDNKNYVIISAIAKGQKGFEIVCTDDTVSGKACIIGAGWEKEANYTPAMARVVALDMAKWLVEQGTDKSF